MVVAVAECDSATAAVEAAATATKCRRLIRCDEGLVLFIPVSSQDHGVPGFARANDTFEAFVCISPDALLRRS